MTSRLVATQLKRQVPDLPLPLAFEAALHNQQQILRSRGACHQYLDGPRDAVQVMASIGEYRNAWWRRDRS